MFWYAAAKTFTGFTLPQHTGSCKIFLTFWKYKERLSRMKAVTKQVCLKQDWKDILHGVRTQCNLDITRIYTISETACPKGYLYLKMVETHNYKFLP
jgi:hypothetical protein